MSKSSAFHYCFFIFIIQNAQSANAETFGDVHITTEACNRDIFNTLVDMYFIIEKPFDLFRIWGQNKDFFNSNGERVSDPLSDEKVKNLKPNTQILHVSLNSVGGNVDAAIKIGQNTRNSYGFTQVGMQYGYKGKRAIGCFSACVLIYA